MLIVDSAIDTITKFKNYQSSFSPYDLEEGEEFKLIYDSENSELTNWDHGTHVAGIVTSQFDKSSPNKPVISSSVLIFDKELEGISSKEDSAIDGSSNILFSSFEYYLKLTKPKVVNLYRRDICFALGMFISIVLEESFENGDSSERVKFNPKDLEKVNQVIDETKITIKTLRNFQILYLSLPLETMEETLNITIKKSEAGTSVKQLTFFVSTEEK